MCDQTSSHGCEGGLTVSVTTVAKIVSSMPVSPGETLQSVFHDLAAIEPPKRPSSTPFSWQETSNCKFEVWPANESDQSQVPPTTDEAQQTENALMSFSRLPTEIHELVLDHLFGVRASTANNVPSSRGWSTALRHSRRRQLSDVALVSERYRELVQGRLFKHIKVQGTRSSVNEATLFFCEHPHLQKHTRHIEVWSPVWERRTGIPMILPPTSPEQNTLVRVMNAQAVAFEPSSNVSSAYQLASTNSSLYEIFAFVDLVFPEACVLTLEGGHCKKPPMVRHFLDVKEHDERRLPRLDNIRMLILKSAWNIMRTEENFDTIMAALPCLKEWHSSYAKAKSKSYLNISRVVPRLPLSIRHLNLSLESTYSREALSPRFWRKIYPHQTHICVQLAKAIPQLESFTYCGRICHDFFQDVSHLADADQRGNSKLKSLDLTVKNCCRPPSVLTDGSGINDPAFISALETLVIAGVDSLERLKSLDFLRIRFIDLESPMPLLNPFFQLKGNQCTGLWSEKILVSLAVARPFASYIELSDDFGGINYDKDGKIVHREKTSKNRPLSMKVASYEIFSNVIAIN